MAFQKAKKEKIWIKVLIGGPSGSGKTYSSLRLAQGIAKKANTRIAAIDTENGRIRYYADEFDFDDMQLNPPFTPEKYNKIIDEAVDGGYKVLIIDSITHEWKGSGGCIEIHDSIPGNSYTAWAKVKPRHQKFVDKLIQSPIHIVCTARGKDEYILEDKNGKQVPKKVGIGIEQQDDAEYNYTVTFNLDQASHVADATKDNTHLFEGRYEELTEKDGEALYNWANNGKVKTTEPKKADPKEESKDEPKSEDTKTEPTLENIIKSIDAKAKSLAKTPQRNELIGAIGKHNNGNANYNTIKDITVAKAVLDEINKIGGNN